MGKRERPAVEGSDNRLSSVKNSQAVDFESVRGWVEGIDFAGNWPCERGFLAESNHDSVGLRLYFRLDVQITRSTKHCTQ
jgi:hypothetical protein